MSDEPENLVLRLLRGLRSDVADVKVDVRALDAKLDHRTVELKADIHTLRGGVAADLLKDTREQITGLRRAIVDYHSTAIGQGAHISQLQVRMRRVEQHLNLPSIDSH
jgi:hypothetical protein